MELIPMKKTKMKMRMGKMRRRRSGKALKTQKSNGRMSTSMKANTPLSRSKKLGLTKTGSSI
jgi:hypothetical protein